MTPRAPMRIAILSFEFPPATPLGGIATYSAQLADMLARAGHDVEVFAGGAKMETFRRPSGACIHTLGCTDQVQFALPVTLGFCQRHAEKPFEVMETPEYLAPAFNIAQLQPELAFVVRLHSPAALIARHNLPRESWRQPWLHVARQLKNSVVSLVKTEVPLPVYFAHDTLTQAREFDAREAAVARSADLICSPSRALSSYPATHWAVPASKTIHLPNVYEPSAPILSLPPAGKPSCIGFFGRLEVNKGVLTLAACLPAIARRFPHTKLLFVGPSRPLPGVHADAQEYLGAKCRELGLTAEFAGRQPNDRLHEWYGRCQIVMLPSVWDNFPYVCLEAMAAGRAVIGSTSGGMTDMITPGKTGLLANPARSGDFAAQALRLLGEPGLCEQLGRAARQSVLDRYSAAHLCPHYESAYGRAIAHRQQAGARPTPWLSQPAAVPA